jgi:hypothetical protein
MVLFAIDSQLIPTKQSKEELQTGRFPSDYRGSNFVCNDLRLHERIGSPCRFAENQPFYGTRYQTTTSSKLKADSFPTPFRRPRSVSSLDRRLPPSSPLPRPTCRPPLPHPPPSAQDQSGSSATRCLELGHALLDLSCHRPELGHDVAGARATSSSSPTPGAWSSHPWPV